MAVQKTGPGFDAGAGSKWPLRNYRLFLVGKYGHQATDRMFLDVEELCVNTLLSVQKVMISDVIRLIASLIRLIASLIR